MKNKKIIITIIVPLLVLVIVLFVLLINHSSKGYEAQIPHRMQIYARSGISDEDVWDPYISKGAQLGFLPQETTAMMAELSGIGFGVPKATNIVQTMIRAGIGSETAIGMAAAVRASGYQGDSVGKILEAVSDQLYGAAINEVINQGDVPQAMEEIKRLLDKYSVIGASPGGVANIYLMYYKRVGFFVTPNRVGSMIDAMMTPTVQAFNNQLATHALRPLAEMSGQSYNSEQLSTMQSSMAMTLDMMPREAKRLWFPIMRHLESQGKEVVIPMEAVYAELFLSELRKSQNDVGQAAYNIVENLGLFPADLKNVLLNSLEITVHIDGIEN